MRDKLRKMPYLGDFVSWLNYVRTSRSKYIDSSSQLTKFSESLEEVRDTLSGLETTLSKAIEEQSVKVESQLSVLNIKLSEREHQKVLIKQKTKDSQTTGLFAENHELDAFYLAFENRFRGTEEEISERLSDYTKIFSQLDTSVKKKPVLDIGCGRGEFLSFAQSLGFTPIGVDLNENMVSEAQKRGFKAIQEDAVSFLSKQKDNSMAVISGFHLVEHIPFEDILTLFSECYRVITPGGFILFETPNPENVIIGSCNFYTDPSHLNPIPPHLLQFTAEYQGFSPVNILRLRANVIDTDENLPKGLDGIVERFSSSPDYAIVGYKST